MFALLWAAFMFFVAFSVWRHAREDRNEPSLSYSSRDRAFDSFWSRFLRKMTLAITVLCGASAWAAWSGAWTLAFLLFLAVPATVAFQVVRSRSALENNYKRSLPPS